MNKFQAIMSSSRVTILGGKTGELNMSDDISPSTGSKPKASREAEPPIAFLLD